MTFGPFYYGERRWARPRSRAGPRCWPRVIGWQLLQYVLFTPPCVLPPRPLPPRPRPRPRPPSLALPFMPGEAPTLLCLFFGIGEGELMGRARLAVSLTGSSGWSSSSLSPAALTLNGTTRAPAELPRRTYGVSVRVELSRGWQRCSGLEQCCGRSPELRGTDVVVALGVLCCTATPYRRHVARLDRPVSLEAFLTRHLGYGDHRVVHSPAVRPGSFGPGALYERGCALLAFLVRK